MHEQALWTLMPHIKHYAQRMAASRPSGPLGAEDLVHVAVEAILNALETFDKSRGIPFEGYVASRWRGAIHDELRAMDWVTRRIRKEQRDMLTAVEGLRRRLAREPHAEEIAAALDIDIETLDIWQADTRGCGMMSLNAPVKGVEDEDICYQDILPSPMTPSTETTLLRHSLEKAIARLPPPLDTIVTLRYTQGMDNTTIAHAIGCCREYVSTLHTKALRLLRKYFKDNA